MLRRIFLALPLAVFAPKPRPTFCQFLASLSDSAVAKKITQGPAMEIWLDHVNGCPRCSLRV